MSKEDKLYKIWVYLQAEPLFWITLTLGAFLVGDYLYKKSKLKPFELLGIELDCSTGIIKF